MKLQTPAIIMASLAVTVSGCSSRPRQFTATLSPPASDETQYEQDLAKCTMLVRNGVGSNFKSAVAQSVGGTAAGFAAGVGVASVTNAAGGGFATTIGLAGYSIPFFGIASGFGISRAIRSGREKKLKSRMSACLDEYGYKVETWVVQKKKKPNTVKS
jgi:hypothetical protein